MLFFPLQVEWSYIRNCEWCNARLDHHWERKPWKIEQSFKWDVGHSDSVPGSTQSPRCGEHMQTAVIKRFLLFKTRWNLMTMGFCHFFTLIRHWYKASKSMFLNTSKNILVFCLFFVVVFQFNKHTCTNYYIVKKNWRKKNPIAQMLLFHNLWDLADLDISLVIDVSQWIGKNKVH